MCFIEVNHGRWDQHTDHRRDLAANRASTDVPVAALLDDLHQRGLLDDTLNRAASRKQTPISSTLA